MKNNILKKFTGLMAAGVFGVAIFGLVACNPEPDESNRYTATNETIGSFIKKDSMLTSFDYILTRVGLDRMMMSYGQYTCYAPNNDGIQEYIDSLYRDPESVEAGNPHNGMEDHGDLGVGQHAQLEWLSDSLCNDIARYHLANELYSIVEMGGSGVTISTMLGRPLSSKVDSLGYTVLNDVARVLSEDNLVENGIVHIMDKVAPRSTRLLADELERQEEFKLFSWALEVTGMCDSITKSTKGIKYTIQDLNGDNRDTGGESLYWPEECKVAYTIFAETDAVLASKGITTEEQLVEYANRIYGGATGWYDNLIEKGLWNYDQQQYVKSVSTGSDYHNRNNALNMFVSYHILYAGMAKDQLLFENKTGVSVATSCWNYANNADQYDYYETMLPQTILKIWKPYGQKYLYINRYQTFNTLTDSLATMGINNHTLIYPGARIERDNVKDIIAYNGYVHRINDILVYNEQVPNGVLNERMRFESTTMLPEFINNGFRYMLSGELSALNAGGSGARVAFPMQFFDGVKCYSEGSLLRYNIKGYYNAYQADCFQGWGKYDLAVKLHPVPSGLYELRMAYSPMGHGGFMQFYIGTSSNMQDMQAMSIPLDVTIDETDPRIGWTVWYEEADLGVATDEAMRNRGYMRGPMSYTSHPERGWDNQDANQRGSSYGNVILRRILDTRNFKQSEDYWLRIKNVLPDGDTNKKWQFDYVELVPMSVINNEMYSEDWY